MQCIYSRGAGFQIWGSKRNNHACRPEKYFHKPPPFKISIKARPRNGWIPSPVPLTSPPSRTTTHAMSRASVLLVLFFCIALAFASPVQRGNATVEALDKRITHVGRVRVASFIFKSALTDASFCPGNVVQPQRRRRQLRVLGQRL